MVGFTGVVWFPRGATVNSLALYGGPGPVPLSAASASWTQLAGLFSEAGAAMTAAVGELAAGWEGPAADVAYASLGTFGVWLAETIEHAGRMAATTGAGAAAYSAAALVMPSPVEIAATRAAMAAVTVAAAPTGAGLGASAAAAEAAEREMDIRAALAMDGYEGASTVLSVPIPFRPAPPITVPERQGVSLVATAASDLSRAVADTAAGAQAEATEFLASGAVDPQAVGQATAAATRAVGAVGGPPATPSHVDSVSVTAAGAAAPSGGGTAAAFPGAPGPHPAAAPTPTAASAAVPGSGAAAPMGPSRAASLAKLAPGAVQPQTPTGRPGPVGSSDEAAPGRGAMPRAAVPGRLRGGAGADGGGRPEDDYGQDEADRRFGRIEDGRLVVPAVLGAAGR